MPLVDRSDKTWEKIAQSDPYYGVLTDDQYRSDRMTDSAMAEFFRSGEEHIGHAIAKSEKHLGCTIDTQRALDFGCGAGRLLLPLARTFADVVGVDISPAYLALAKQNCEKVDASNVRLTGSLDALHAEAGTFNFVHSHLVFLHIPRRRGVELIGRLAGLLAPGGVGSVQVLYRRDVGRGRRTLNVTRKYFLPLHWVLNAAVRRPAFDPMMQANEYPLNDVLDVLTSTGVGAVYIEMTNVGEDRFAYVYFRRPS